MRKNKNGFTLIEILGVIIILSVLVIITYPLVVKQTKSTTNDIDVATENLIKNAANNYVNDRYNEYVIGNSYCIKLQDLVDAGEVTEDMIKSNSTEIDVSETNIKVDTLSATNVEEFSYTLSTDACYSVSQDIIIDLNYVTTSKISVKTDYVSNGGFIWYVDGNEVTSNEVTSCTTSTCLIGNLNENTYHRFQVEVTDEDNKVYRSYEVTYETKAMIAPTCTVSATDWASSKTVTFNTNMANDEEIEYYYFYENDEFNRQIIDVFPKEITLSENAIILAHVIDDYSIGGVPQNIKTTKCVVDKIDVGGPFITVAADDDNYKQSHSIAVRITDDLSGFKSGGIIQYGWGLSSDDDSDVTYIDKSISYNESDKIIDFTITQGNLTGSYYLWIKSNNLGDLADNAVSIFKSDVIKFDNMGPIITASPSGTTNPISSLSVLVDVDDLSLNISTAEYYLVKHEEEENKTSDYNVTNSEISRFEQRIGGLLNIGDVNKLNGYRVGDVDKSGYVSAYDAVLILRYIDNLESLDDLQKRLADIDGDLHITSSDADKVQELNTGYKNLFNGTYYLYIKTITDSAGNEASAEGNVYCSNDCIFNGVKYFKFGPYVIDTAAPQISLSVSDGWTYSKEKEATITIKSQISGVALSSGTYTIKYAWGTSPIACSNMTNSTVITVSEGNISASANVTISGQTGAGKLYVCNQSVITDANGNSLSAGQIKAADMYLDNTSPTISLSVDDGTTYSKSKNGLITIADTSGSGLQSGSYTIKYAWGTSSIACSNMTNSTVITVSEGNISASANVTISGQTGAGKLYICNDSAITDMAENSLLSNQLISADMYLDNILPTISLSVADGTTPSKSKNGIVSINDNGGSGLKPGNYIIKYAWRTSSIACSDMTTTITVTATATDENTYYTVQGIIPITGKSGDGKLYICNSSVITDRAGNSLPSNQLRSADMYLINTYTCYKTACRNGADYYNSGDNKCVASYGTIDACNNVCGNACMYTDSPGSHWTCGVKYSPSCTEGVLKNGYCYLYNQTSCPSGWVKK